MCASSPTITSSPRWQWESIAVRLLCCPLVVRGAASFPMTAAASASRRLTVGSSRKTSSPSSASAIALRISGGGSVTVSLRRSAVFIASAKEGPPAGAGGPGLTGVLRLTGAFPQGLVRLSAPDRGHHFRLLLLLDLIEHALAGLQQLLAPQAAQPRLDLVP